MNADEASVMGAALYGAALSKQFRTKDIRVADLSPKEVHLIYHDSKFPLSFVCVIELIVDTDDTPISQLIFPKDTKLGSKKTLTIPKMADFPLQISYLGHAGSEPT